MSRPLRLHIPNTLHHVVARGNAKQCIFDDHRDYELFLELLGKTLSRFGVRCLSYSLLWNHYHLLLKSGDIPISRMMQQLNSAYSQRFNHRHGRVGHVLQGRFGSRIVQDEHYARAVVRYIALNPSPRDRSSVQRIGGGAVTPPVWRWHRLRVFSISWNSGSRLAPAIRGSDANA